MHPLVLIRAGSTLLIIRIRRSIRNAHVPDLVPNLHPSIAGGRDREEPTKEVVCPRSHDEAGEEVDVVDVLRPQGDLATNRTDEANNVDQDSRYVRSVTAPVEAVPEVVRAGVAGVVEIFDLVVTLPDYVVIANDDAGDGGEEHRVR